MKRWVSSLLAAGALAATWWLGAWAGYRDGAEHAQRQLLDDLETWREDLARTTEVANRTAAAIAAGREEIASWRVQSADIDAQLDQMAERQVEIAAYLADRCVFEVNLGKAAASSEGR